MDSLEEWRVMSPVVTNFRTFHHTSSDFGQPCCEQNKNEKSNAPLLNMLIHAFPVKSYH